MVVVVVVRDLDLVVTLLEGVVVHLLILLLVVRDPDPPRVQDHDHDLDQLPNSGVNFGSELQGPCSG